jgi:hypothetical protein
VIALVDIAPLDEAVKNFGAKSVVASKLRTAQWEKVPLYLRERALFSAGVDHARFLSTVQEKLRAALEVQREKVAHGEAIVDRSSFIGDLRRLAIQEGLGTGQGGLTDVASSTRLGLIFDMQLRMAQGYAQRKMDLDPDVLDAFPAQELVREEERKQPRDWESRWQAAGGQLSDGRMIALKTDPVWTKISRFGTPWPPYVGREEAEQLGLIEPGQTVSAEDEYFNDQLAASAEHLDEQFLKDSFGDQVQIKDGKARWLGNLIGDLTRDVAAVLEKDKTFDSAAFKGRSISFGKATASMIEKAAPVRDLSGSRMEIRPDNVYHILRQHGAGRETRKTQRGVTRADLEMLPFVWREPDSVEAAGSRRLKLTKELHGKLVVVDWEEFGDGRWQPVTMWVEEKR